jgi:sortase A
MKLHLIRRRKPLTQSRPWSFAQSFFLIAGLLALGWVAYSYAARYIYQAYENREFDRALVAKNVEPSLPGASATRHLSAASPRALIGRIVIPRLGISAMVKEGIDYRTLGLAVGHIPSTAMPGETGNVGLAAHRDNLFRNLKDVARDDEITLTTLDNTYTYRVASFSIVNPEEVSVLTPRDRDKTLTLITCYPFYFVGHAPKRFVVRARQVMSTAAAVEKPGTVCSTRASRPTNQCRAGAREVGPILAGRRANDIPRETKDGIQNAAMLVRRPGKGINSTGLSILARRPGLSLTNPLS